MNTILLSKYVKGSTICQAMDAGIAYLFGLFSVGNVNVDIHLFHVCTCSFNFSYIYA